NRDAVVVRADDRRGDVLETSEPCVAPEDDLLSGGLDVAAAADAVVLRDRLLHHLDRDAVRREAGRIERGSILLEGAAEADDLDDAGHLSQLRADLPLDDGA